MDDFDDDEEDGYNRRAPAVISRRRVDSSDSDGDAPRPQPFINSSMLGFGEAPPPDIFGGAGMFEDEPPEISRGFPASSSSGSRQRLQPPASSPSCFEVGASSASSSSTKNARFSDMPASPAEAVTGRSLSPTDQDGRNRPLNVRRLSAPQTRPEDRGRHRIDGLAIEEEDEEAEEKRAEVAFGEARPDGYDCTAESVLFSEIPDDCLMGESSVPTAATHSPSERISFNRVSFNRESFAERASFDRVSLKRISHQKIIDPHSAHWAEYEDRNSFGDTTTEQVLGSIFEIEGDHMAGDFFDTDIPVEGMNQADAPDSFAAIVAAAAASARPGLLRPQASNGRSASASSGAGASSAAAASALGHKDGITPNSELPGGRRPIEGDLVTPSSDLAMLCELEEAPKDSASSSLPFSPAIRTKAEKIDLPFSLALSRETSEPQSSQAQGASLVGGAPAEEPAPKLGGLSGGLSAKMRASGLGSSGLKNDPSTSGQADDENDPFGLGARSVWNSNPAGDLGFGLESSSSRRGGANFFGVAASERRTTGQMPSRRMVDEDVAPPILVPSHSEHSLRANARATAASCTQQYAGGALGFAAPSVPQPPADAAPPPPPRTPDGRPTTPAVPPLDAALQSRGSTTALDVVRMAQRRVTF